MNTMTDIAVNETGATIVKIGKVTSGMTLFQVCNAIRLSPDAHPDVWHKRLEELRSQNRHDEAKWIEATFPEYMSKAAAIANEKTGRMIARMFDNLGIDTEEST